MSVGLPSRGWAGPRAGTFAPRRRSPLARAFAKGGVARSWDWPLIGVTCALAAFGTVLVWAATEPSLRTDGLNPHMYLEKAALWAFLGVILMFVTASVDYRRIRRWSPVLYGLSLLLLLAVLVAGQSVNGAKAWIALPGGFQVEPSEFAKVGLILSTAWLLSRRDLRSGRPTIKDVLFAVLAAAPLIALVVKEPALGVTLVLVFTLAGMIVVSGLRVYWVLGGLAGAAAAIYAVAKLHLLKGYQLTRLTAFLHPQQNLAGTGYNGLEAKIAVGSGGLTGEGLFHGTFTGGNFVPSVQTDFIFTVAGEELGFAGCALIVAMLAFIVFRAIRAAQIADDMFGMLVASGVALWFAFQGFVNIGMTIGIMPITGLPLPFVSYGGSAIFADMIAIGLLHSVRRHHDLPALRLRTRSHPPPHDAGVNRRYDDESVVHDAWIRQRYQGGFAQTYAPARQEAVVTAWHEAGHAVAALAVGARFSSASIRAGERSSGRVHSVTGGGAHAFVVAAGGRVAEGLRDWTLPSSDAELRAWLASWRDDGGDARRFRAGLAGTRFAGDDTDPFVG